MNQVSLIVTFTTEEPLDEGEIATLAVTLHEAVTEPSPFGVHKVTSNPAGVTIAKVTVNSFQASYPHSH